jgi:peptidyl-prolyl cis-trans isomerase C
MLCKITLRTKLGLSLLAIVYCYIVSCSTVKTTAVNPAAKATATQTAKPAAKQADSNTPVVIISLGDKKLTLQQIKWMAPKIDDQTILRAVDWWLENELLYAEAQKRGITKEPKTKFIAELVKKKAIGDQLISQVRDAVKISDEQVRDYYEKNKETDTMLVQSGYLSFSHIAARTLEEAQAAMEKLKAGEDFNSLAKEISIDSDAKNGGAVKNEGYNNVARDYGTRFFDLISTAKQGELIGPVKVKGNIYEIARQEGKIVPTPLPFEEVKAKLKSRLLLIEKRNIPTNLAKLLKEKAAAKIVKSPLLIKTEEAVSKKNNQR